MQRAAVALGVVIFCALGLFVNAHLAFSAGKGGMDFNQFYAASRLAGTGHLYDWSALSAIEAENGPPIRGGRLPVVSFGVKLISWMPFAPALRVWQAASVAAFLAVCFLWPGASRPGLLAALAWSTPAVYMVSLGQDVAFWLLFFALGVALLDRGYAVPAGAAFALCLCKYHLAVGIPILLIAQKRWTTLAAGALVTTALLAASFAIEGPSWPLGYLRTLTAPDFSPGAHGMPNLHGLASWLPGAAIFELVGAAGIVVALWFACRRGVNIGFTGAAAAGCGLLLGNHGYVSDCAILIPLTVLTIQARWADLALRALGLILLSPALMLLLVGSVPWVGQLLLVGFVAWTLVRAAREWPIEDREKSGPRERRRT